MSHADTSLNPSTGSSKGNRSVRFAEGTALGREDSSLGIPSLDELLDKAARLGHSVVRFVKPPIKGSDGSSSVSSEKDGADVDPDAPVSPLSSASEDDDSAGSGYGVSPDSVGSSAAAAAMVETLVRAQNDALRAELNALSSAHAAQTQELAAARDQNASLATQLAAQRHQNAALVTELDAVRGMNAVLASQVAAVVQSSQTRIRELESQLHVFTQGVKALLTSFQRDLTARMQELSSNVNPAAGVAAVRYHAQTLRNQGDRKSADLLEELFAKYSALSTAKDSLQQNSSSQNLGQVFNTLLASRAVRRNHKYTRIRDFCGVTSGTHQAIAKQALAFSALGLANLHQPQEAAQAPVVA